MNEQIKSLTEQLKAVLAESTEVKEYLAARDAYMTDSELITLVNEYNVQSQVYDTESAKPEPDQLLLTSIRARVEEVYNKITENAHAKAFAEKESAVAAIYNEIYDTLQSIVVPEHHHDHDECCGHEHDHEHHHDHGECDDPNCSCHDHHHHHHADEVFTSWGKETPKVYTQADIDRILTALDSGDYGAILRAKGIVNGTDGAWIEFDYVPEEHEIRAGHPDYTGRLCVIGSNLKEEKLAELFGL